MGVSKKNTREGKNVRKVRSVKRDTAKPEVLQQEVKYSEIERISQTGNEKIMHQHEFIERRAIFTGGKPATQTFVSLSGDLESRRTRKKDKKLHLFFEQIAAGGFLYKCGIRNGDRLISVNFFPVQGVPLDLLIEAICLLTPQLLFVERTLKDGEVVKIVVIIDIRIDKDNHPFLRFCGFYWDVERMGNSSRLQIPSPTNPASEDSNYHYLRFHGCCWDSKNLVMPGKIPNMYLGGAKPMTTYKYFEKKTNCVIFTTDGSVVPYWLTVYDSEITFERIKDQCITKGPDNEAEKPDKASFTLYKYISNKKSKVEPVILVPDDDPTNCLAATREQGLTIVPFDENMFTTESPLPVNGSFLNLTTEETPDTYKIESSVEAGQYVTKTDDNRAVMSHKYTKFTIKQDP